MESLCIFLVPHLSGEGVRFYVSWARTATSGSKCSPPDLTTSSGSECSPLDLNHKESPKMYQIERQKVCQNRCQIECLNQKECQNICQKECQIECQNKYAIFIHFQMVCQKLCQNSVSRWGSLEECFLLF